MKELLLFYYINPHKMHILQILFYLTTTLHISGVTITHLQEHKTTVTTASVNRCTLLLSAAIVEELELVWVYCGWRTVKRLPDAVVTVVLRSWRWVIMIPETCTAIVRQNKMCNMCIFWDLHSRILLRCTNK
jgi:hypothetical protein